MFRYIDAADVTMRVEFNRNWPLGRAILCEITPLPLELSILCEITP
jgi:hypothetical protein